MALQLARFASAPRGLRVLPGVVVEGRYWGGVVPDFSGGGRAAQRPHRVPRVVQSFLSNPWLQGPTRPAVWQHVQVSMPMLPVSSAITDIAPLRLSTLCGPFRSL